MSFVTDPIRYYWDDYKQRPFGRLVQLFVARIFRGGGDSDGEGLDLGVGLVLTLLAMPGGFVSLFLLDKYGSFLQWLRGVKDFDALLVAFPDEYFFIVLSMTVTGAVTVWRWDSIFPDRRDYMNLVHLPISTRTIFSANLVAVLLIVGLVTVDVNAASCILFPTVVTAVQSKFLFFVKFAAVHALGVTLSSIFAFFAVFGTLGLLMALLPPQAFRRVSTYVRGIVVVYLVALLCSSFAVPQLLQRAQGAAPGWTWALPSCWFVGLCQLLRGRANPALTELARLSLPAMLLVVVLAILLYTIGYKRQFMRIAESGESAPLVRVQQRFGPARLLHRILLRTPFQKGCFSFSLKTLFRSETHRLVMTAVAGLALVLGSQALMNAFEGSKSAQEAALTPDALSIPFIVSFLVIVGLRVVFEIPVELRANWIFQLMLDPERQECEPLARKIMLLSALAWIPATTFAAYAYLQGLRIALLHTFVLTLWAVLLTNLLLIRFHKLPFTCTLPIFKQHSIVILISFCFGFLIYAGSIPEFESAALTRPIRLLSLAPFAALAWYIPRHLAGNTIDMEKKLIFEESATQTVERLRLSE